MRVPEKVHRTFSHLALIEIETFLFHEFASTCLYSKYWVFRHFRLDYSLIIHSLLSCFLQIYLQVVPTLCVDESTPALAPSMTVMDFCYEIRTQIDIDLYLED